MTTQAALVDSLSARAKRVGLTMAAVCQRAGVAPSTPSRWKAGQVGVTFRTLRKLEEVVEAEEASMAVTAGSPAVQSSPDADANSALESSASPGKAQNLTGRAA